MKKCYLMLLVLFYSASAWAQNVQVMEHLSQSMESILFQFQITQI